MRRRPTKSQVRRKVRKKATPEQYFWLNDGRAVKNMKELADAFETMNPNVFHTHVNENRNDFSNWAYEVLEDRVLSTKLGEVKTSHEAQVVVLKHIVDKLS